MVTFLINGTKYQAKTSWNEIEADKIVGCDTFRGELSYLTDVPCEILDAATDQQLFPLYTLTSFLNELDEIQILEAINVPTAPYEQLELSRQQSKTGKTYQKLLKIARVYYPEEKNVLRLLGLGHNLAEQIATFLSNYKEMTSAEAEAEEVAAGIEELSAFGSFATIFELAQRDLTKLREVFGMPAIQVMTALHYSWKQARYQKALWDIKNPRTP